MLTRPPERKSSSESSEICLSVDGVKSLVQETDFNTQFSCDVVGYINSDTCPGLQIIFFLLVSD